MGDEKKKNIYIATLSKKEEEHSLFLFNLFNPTNGFNAFDPTAGNFGD